MAQLHSDTSSAALSPLMVTLTPFSEWNKWSWGQDVMDFLCCSLFHTIFLMLVVRRLQPLQGCACSTQEHPISHSTDLFFSLIPSVSSSFSPSSISYLFLNVLSQRCHHLCFAMFCSGSVLGLAGMGRVQHRVASRLFSQRSPAPRPATKTAPPMPSTATQYLHYFLCGCVLCCCFHPWVCLILLGSSEESVTIERKPGCLSLVQYK